VNGDGKVDDQELSDLLNERSGGEKNPNSDVNDDGQITIEVVAELQNVLSGSTKNEKTVSVPLRQIKKGDRGQEVLVVQVLLTRYGYRDQNGNKLDIDADFGSKTEFAVKSFQRENELKVDGVCGYQTWVRALTGK
jgi:peptidoglycan hydrolase-like protein with peptidoglycan-binding domain